GVVRAPAAGSTLLLCGAFSAINATLYDKLNFNFIRDIAPVAGIMRGPYVMVVNPSVPRKSVPEFISYAQANPRKLNMASAGTGGHIAGELFKMMAGVDMVHEHSPYGHRDATAILIAYRHAPLSDTRCTSVAKRFVPVFVFCGNIVQNSDQPNSEG